ncbi:unnamed protein product [Rotaria sp. Silwood1]|nr:unnamed protein product [Rotaria sp. Silwood1]CAF4893451.1 unnamed protein product [Rotaria sp. Silwood1]
MNQSDAFISRYNNWENALGKNQRFSRHESNAAHKYAVSNHQQLILRTNTQTTVINVLDKEHVELIRKNRQHLSKIVSAILLCSPQLICLREHEEKIILQGLLEDNQLSPSFHCDFTEHCQKRIQYPIAYPIEICIHLLKSSFCEEGLFRIAPVHGKQK